MSRARAPGPDGVAVVDKPAGPTSHDVVAQARRVLGTRKVGHAGTLDPDASGVLVLGVGRATRLVRFLVGLPKRYRATVVLGTATSTLDASGEVTGSWDMAGIGLDDIRRATRALTGPIEQIPPMVSAIRVGGRRLHELAREGVEVERPPRSVEVYSFEVGPAVGPGRFPIEVACSSGTYVRSLAADLGRALGGGAHLDELRRLEVGPFGLEGAVSLDELAPGALLPLAAAVGHLAAVVVEGELATDVSHGKVLPLERLGVAAPGPWAVLGGDGELLAVYDGYAGGTVKPTMVVAKADDGS